MENLKTGHVGLSVTDLKKSVTFYRSIFRFEVIEEITSGDRQFAFLGYDGATVLTLWQQSSNVFNPDHAGLHHLAFEVDDVATVRSLEATVRAMGAHLRSDRSGAYRETSSACRFFFCDPDGVRLEIYAATSAAPRGRLVGPPACGLY
jgi:catechol 2,3-dioxygenase-like lactoylglutathione lyase family enzyme